MNKQQTKAMELALDYIIATNKSSQFWLVPESNLNKTVTAIKEALAQDALQALHDENERLGLYEQEPVAWMDADGNISDNNDHKCFPIPLYTTPYVATPHKANASRTKRGLRSCVGGCND